MAIQTINIGSSANDGTGDPLRTAFDKVNDNFVELYAVTGAGSGQNLAISANSLISENTNGSITIDPNGTGTIILSADSAVSGTTASTSATSGSFTAAGGAGIAADLHVGDDVTLISDAAVLGFGADKDVTFTHVADTGLLLNSTRTIQFNDASQNIGAPDATTLDINATDEVEINATLIDVNGNLDVSGSIVGATTLSAATITATTAFVPDASDGAALGTTALEFSDLFLADAAVINLGADQDVTLTHVADTGLTLNGTSKLMFNDASQFVQGISATVLGLGATAEIDLTATAIDINGTASVSGLLTTETGFNAGAVTLTATGAITIAAHAGKILNMAEVGGDAACTFTLPAATGSGAVFKFVVGVVNTSNYIIKVADGTDTIDGSVIVVNDAGDGGTASVISWITAAADDTITLDGTTTGGVSIGDYVVLTDLIADQYTVEGHLNASGTEASPYSATVS